MATFTEGVSDDTRKLDVLDDTPDFTNLSDLAIFDWVVEQIAPGSLAADELASRIGDVVRKLDYDTLESLVHVEYAGTHPMRRVMILAVRASASSYMVEEWLDDLPSLVAEYPHDKPDTRLQDRLITAMVNDDEFAACVQSKLAKGGAA